MSYLKKIGLGVVAIAVIAGATPVAHAQTSAELQAQIQALLGQITALQSQLGTGTSAGVTTTFTRDLTMGSTGADVQSLQQFLNANGYTVATTGAGSPGFESTYFGSLTKAALARYQAANGIAPAVGYFGPITRANINAKAVTPTPTPTPTPGDDGGDDDNTGLQGGAGSLTVDSTSEYASEEVGEGDEDAPVLEFEVEAEGSDVLITSVRVEFVESGATSSEDLDDYAESVSIWFNGEKVGEDDVDDFSESSTEVWTRTITLDEEVIIEEDETEALTVAVTSLNSIDSGDSDSDLWTVDVLNVRFKDAEGVTTTQDTDGDALEQTFDFAPFATATDLELKISLGDEDINDAHVINIHATNETDNADLLSFEGEAEGTSDITLNDVSVNFDSVGVDLEDAVTNVTLWADGEKIGTESITKNTATPGTDETIEFDQLDYTIAAGDTIEFIVKADLESIADGIAAADTISAQISATERALIEAEDESGEDIAAADMTGTAVGDAHAMYDTGIMVDLVSATVSAVTQAEVENTTDSATVSIVFDVTAFDADIFVDGTVTEDGDGTYADGSGANYYITRADTGADAAALTTPAAALTTSSATSAANTTWRVDEGTTDRFTLTVVVSNTLTDDGADDELLFQVALMSIGWDTTAIAATTNSYTFNLDEYEGPPVALGELDAA